MEAVDPVFQAKMLDMLKQTGRPEMVVGWYHSHPGFGCWLSGVDINTQQSFEALSERAVAVVVDPIQSVKGKVRQTVDRAPQIRPPLSKKSFPVGRVGGKNCQSGGRNFSLFFPNFNFIKLECTGGKVKKKLKR